MVISPGNHVSDYKETKNFTEYFDNMKDILNIRI
jgi:hypothetical protein